MQGSTWCSHSCLVLQPGLRAAGKASPPSAQWSFVGPAQLRSPGMCRSNGEQLSIRFQHTSLNICQHGALSSCLPQYQLEMVIVVSELCSSLFASQLHANALILTALGISTKGLALNNLKAYCADLSLAIRQAVHFHSMDSALSSEKFLVQVFESASTNLGY